jgi:hypothetical protein
MNRKVLVLALLLVLSLVLFSLPVSARTVDRAPEAANSARADVSALRSQALKLAPASAGESTESPWTSIASMIVGVDTPGGAGFVLASKRVYIPGGYKADLTLHETMQSYHVPSNTWTNETEMLPVVVDNGLDGWADSAVCVNPANSQVHVVNGVDGAFLYAAHQVYDPAAPAGSRWSYLSYPQLASGDTYYSQSSGCAFIGGMMYLFGGYAVVDPNPAEVTRATWVYNPSTDTWSDTGKLMGTGRLWVGYASNSMAAFAVGGTDNVTTFIPTDTTERFTPAGGWVAGTSMPAGEGRLAGNLSVLGTTLVQFGGASYAGGFFLEAETLVCGSSGACASWGPAPVPGGKQLGAPRWFAGGTGAGATPLIGVIAGGIDAGGSISSAEKLP